MALGSLPGNWAGVALILLAFVLAAIEMNVDGFGVLGALGIASFVLGGDPALRPLRHSHPSPVLPDLSVSPWVLIPTAGVLTVGIGGLVVAMLDSRHRTRRAGPPRPLLVGMTGIVSAALNPEGAVRVRGETWNARAADGSRIERGAEVRVRQESGPLLYVDRTGRTETEEGRDDG